MLEKNSSTWTYCNPVEIISEVSYLEALSSLQLDGRILLITSRSFTRRGVVGEVIDTLSAAKVQYYDEITANPTIDSIDSVIKQFRDMNFDTIIALGGGSVIDTAKAISVTLGEENLYIRKLLDNKSKLDGKPALKLIAIPTTAGTGSEVTPFATIWEPEAQKKYSLDHKSIFPHTAILDANLTLTLPYEQTLFTGLDAISHAMESLWNVNASPLSRLYSRESLKIISGNFRELLDDLDNLKLRKEMQTASMLAGIAISQTRTAIAHSISYPLTYTYNVPHGLASSFTLEAIAMKLKEEGVLDKEEQGVLDEVVNLLQGLPLKKMIMEYLSLNEAIELVSEMFHPERMKNFILKLTELIVKQILISSFLPQRNI
jgi:phosphonate metabolism-associated iron-containing alcohol dehydrogenase